MTNQDSLTRGFVSLFKKKSSEASARYMAGSAPASVPPESFGRPLYRCKIGLARI